MDTAVKVRSLLDQLQVALDKKDLVEFNNLSNQVHEITDGVGLTSSEYDEWDSLRDKVQQIELQQFLNKNNHGS